MTLGLTVPDLPSFLKLIAAARECMELSATPLKYRQRIVSELRNIERDMQATSTRDENGNASGPQVDHGYERIRSFHSRWPQRAGQ